MIGFRLERQNGSSRASLICSEAPTLCASSNALVPWLFFACLEAPLISKCLMILYDFATTARCKGVRPSLSTSFMFSLQAIKRVELCSCPSNAAMCKGVLPFLSFVLIDSWWILWNKVNKESWPEIVAM